MEKTPLKTAEQVKQEFLRKGKSISGWAKEHGFSRGLVHAVLRGERSCLRGDSHKIAVLLGIKEGEIAEEGSDLCAKRSEQGRNLGEEVPTIKNASLINSLVGGGHG